MCSLFGGKFIILHRNKYKRSVLFSVQCSSLIAAPIKSIKNGILLDSKVIFPSSNIFYLYQLSALIFCIFELTFK